jgi:hypothetical protein
MSSFHARCFKLMHAAVIAMALCGCASPAPGTAATDSARAAETRKKEAELAGMERVGQRDDADPVPIQTVK